MAQCALTPILTTLHISANPNFIKVCHHVQEPSRILSPSLRVDLQLNIGHDVKEVLKEWIICSMSPKKSVHITSVNSSFTMNSKQETGQTKKRNRTVVSCTECHRRKQKCDRALPCSDCRERGVPEKCKYLSYAHTCNIPCRQDANSTSRKPEQAPGSKSAAKTAVSKYRRIISGKEVIMTPESVAALASDELVSESETASQLVTGPHNADSGISQNSPITTPGRRYILTTLPIPATVVSGLQNNNSLSNYDPFSILPEIQGEPLPKHLLIRYCTFSQTSEVIKAYS